MNYSLEYLPVPYFSQKKEVSKLSLTIIIILYIIVPPPPKNITTGRLNSTHIRVSWLPLSLAEATGFILSYRISYQVAGNKRQTLAVIVSGAATSVVIGGLDPDSLYTVFVGSSTSRGEGPSSKGITVQSTCNCYYHYT